MKLGTLAAAAAISLVGVTGASAQVFVAEPYVTGSYIAPPVYAAPAPVYSAPAPVIVGEPLYVAPAIGGYVPPKYSYTINSPRRGMIYSSYRPSVECTIDGYCY
ncbi:MAG TPA: hypothetical protein VGQ63_22865 [Pseudolabrys sp.]|jgi:hypothetical protein|nr:hypothetical protein [Pseudolabrys sp.]